MKILIMKRDKLGDMFLVTPMLNHLRQSLPNAKIDFLANDYNYFVLRGNHDIDNLFIYQRSKHNGKFRPLAFFPRIIYYFETFLKKL
jgi:heptosyltransferase-3